MTCRAVTSPRGGPATTRPGPAGSGGPGQGSSSGCVSAFQETPISERFTDIPPFPGPGRASARRLGAFSRPSPDRRLPRGRCSVNGGAAAALMLPNGPRRNHLPPPPPLPRPARRRRICRRRARGRHGGGAASPPPAPAPAARQRRGAGGGSCRRGAGEATAPRVT